jgi:hypothetical protein
VVFPIAAFTCALAACGGQTTVHITKAHQALRMYLGAHLAVQKNAGECEPPMSSDPRVVAPENPPTPNCTPGYVGFTAVGVGHTRIYGPLSCPRPLKTGCFPEASWIAIVVTPR